MTNVERHADATNVTLTLHPVDDALQLVLTDNGRGFVLADAKTVDKFGLLGMKELSDLIDGTLRINSAPGRGVTLTLTLPNQPVLTLA